MALIDTVFSTELQKLYKEMDDEPMSMKDFADKMAKILDTQTKTADVTAGINVLIPVTSPQGSPSSGQTSSLGSIS